MNLGELMNKKILIVGAGLSGAVVARFLAEKGFEIDLIERRNHIAGNCFDFIDENGILVHKYGPHLFHTNNSKVISWIQRFAQWIPYKHKVKAMLDDGELVTLPVNKYTAGIVGSDNIISTFFKPYSKKMWGVDLEELDPEIFNRVKVRDDDNEYYFPDDLFQAVPSGGYTLFVKNILDHENITISLETNFSKEMINNYLHCFNSMPIDEYYNYSFGSLPYRSVKFHTVVLPLPKIFDVATVNFTHDSPYTRITEWKNIPSHGCNKHLTVLTYEEPCDYLDNNMERYYPVKDASGLNRRLYDSYAAIHNPNVTFIGRCGQYVYLDMHQVISNSLSIAESWFAKANA
jgi:UDP-galactopyranose mutase